MNQRTSIAVILRHSNERLARSSAEVEEEPIIPVPGITSSLTASGQTGAAFSYQITASNTPTSFNATGLPAGLSVNTSTGLISGTPTSSAVSNVTISATSAGGTGSSILVLTVVWTPLALGASLVAWYDASDAATITQSGGAVSAWNDKSGSGYHLLQGTGTNQPAYSATGFQSNSPGITFDGVDNYLSAASATIGTTAVSGFIFAQFNIGSNLNLLGYQASGDAGPFSANSVILFENQASTSLRTYWKGSQRAIAVPLATPPPASSYLSGSSYHRMATVADGTNDTIYLDNAYTTAAVSTTGTLNTPGTILVGARSGGGQPWSGPVSDILILNRAATAPERAQIDNYLMRHWTRVVVVEGDSLIQASATVPRYVQLYAANSSPAAYIDNLGIAGTDFWTNAGSCLIDRSAATDAHLPANKGGRQYVLYFSFTNNLKGSPYTDPFTTQTAADIAAGYVTYASARKTAGWDKVVIATALPRTDGQADDTFRNALNTILRAPGWSGRVANGGPIDAVCDLGNTSTIMGEDASPTGHPTYWADSVHPSALGMVTLEPIFRATINGL